MGRDGETGWCMDVPYYLELAVIAWLVEIKAVSIADTML